jgi:hypothetical protein
MIAVNRAYQADEAFIFWTRGTSALSRLIVRVTGGQLPDHSDAWSHMGLGFYMADGTQEYFEALAGRHVQGPKPLSKLKAWVQSDPRHRCHIELLPLDKQTSQLKYQIVRSWVGTVGYSLWQLYIIWRTERFSWPMRAVWPGVVCSELVARVLAPEVDLTDSYRTIPDAVNPNSAWRAWKAKAGNQETRT